MNDIKARIKSVQSTMQITKAMELVATSKLRRAKENVERARPYYEALGEAIKSIKASSEAGGSVWMSEGNADKSLYIVIAGDRGLAGGYNANIFRYLRELSDADIIPIGKRACDRFAGKTLLAEHFSYADAKEISDRLCAEFAEGKYDKIGVLCTEYHSLMSQEARVVWLLPMQRAERESSVSAVFEPDEITVLNAVIPEYVAGMIVACVKESFASEVAARRVAMDSAGKNAQEMIDTLELEYNRARQSAITQEITEIVAGSGA